LPTGIGRKRDVDPKRSRRVFSDSLDIHWRTTKKLAEKGLIQKEVDPKDKRSHLISLTEAGKEEAQRMKEKRSKAHQEMLTYLTAEEKQAFGQALAKIEQFYLEKEADVD